MTISRNRILTTHAGSLPRSKRLRELHTRKFRGEAIDEAALEAEVAAAVADVVARQAAAGIDIGNDGEAPRESILLRAGICGPTGSGKTKTGRILGTRMVERLEEPDEKGRYVRLTVDLQYDFALNQPLSPFALAAIELLDRESETYALDVLSVIESTLDNPRQILSAQQFRARGEAVAAMKSEGIEYEERMDLLESVTWPKPLEDVLEAGYDIYRRGHPWVGDYEVSPKTVVRDMYERAMTFGEYVQFYSLSRSEGIVLRYLADAYKALKQTVPDEAKSEELTDLIEWLGELIRQVDSSLIDEWEKLSHPDPDGSDSIPVRAEPKGVTRNARAFKILVRNALFRRVTLAALRRYGDLGDLDSRDGWNAAAWAEALDGYFELYDELGTGPDARGPAMLVIEEGKTAWTVRQIFDDPAGDHDWGISATVDLAASDEEGAAVIHVTDVGQL